jgi:hypothetical protein
MDRDVVNPFPFPVRVVGPGTQPEEDAELQYLAMPRDMNTFRMPIPPEHADAQAMTGARDALAAFPDPAWSSRRCRRRPWRWSTKCWARARSWCR